ncbi:unnamed protein product [Urochloa humidicola]
MPQQGSRPRPEDGGGGGGADGVDRLSDLPEELLLQILGRLDRAREAARTSVLSSRWRGLWTGLLDLTFWDGNGDNADSVEAALAQLTSPTLNNLDICFETAVASQRVSSLLHAAARLAPERFSIDVMVDAAEDGSIILPCFDRTVSLTTNVMPDNLFSLPGSGEFTALKVISMSSFCLDPADLLPICPHLRVLEINDCSDLGMVKVHSESLEVLSVRILSWELDRIDIDAPVLKDVKIEVETEGEFSVSFSAPAVKNLDWKCYS